MGRRLILADGTTIEGGESGYAGGSLWCYLPGWTMDKAAKVFCDERKTVLIRFEYGEMEDVYSGYTVCTNIMISDGQASVCLVKG